LARAVRFELCARGDLRGGWTGGDLSRFESGAPAGPAHTAGIRYHLSGHRGDFPAADRPELASTAVLVRGEGRIDPVRLHVGSRHAAAIPLRPTHALHLAGPFPGRRIEPAGDRLSCRLVFVKWTA